MAEREQEPRREQGEEDQAPEKRPWVKPAIRASAPFEVQAMACARPRTGPPFCNGGVS